MYELIFKERFAILLAALVLMVITCFILGARRMWLRGLMYNLFPAMSAAFYLVALVSYSKVDKVDIIAGFIFELTILILFILMLKHLRRSMAHIRLYDSIRILKWMLLMQFLVSLPNLATAGFGIFSDGSRLEYLSANPFAKYLTYSVILITSIQAALLASLVSQRGYFGILGWSVITTNLALSIVSGSKGSVFLWILMIAALIDYKKAHIPIYKLIAFSGIIVFAALLSSVLVAGFLGISLDVFLDLAFNRFLLVNDARALALDLRSSHSTQLSLLSESFRSLSRIIGAPPYNPPIGVLLYDEGLSIGNGAGANASLMALATYYFTIGYALIPALIGILGAVLMFLFLRIMLAYFRNSVHKVVLISIFLSTISTYSQDFLGFQLLIPVVMLFAFLIAMMHRQSLDNSI